MKQDKQHAIFILLAICLIVLGFVALTYCVRRGGDTPGITPTFAISETPSITPIPPTPTATPISGGTPFQEAPTFTATLTATPSPLAVTAVISPSVTAVTPSPTPTGTATPETPTGTPTEDGFVIEKGNTYWDSAKAKYGRFEAWQCLKRVNGWHERMLPIGEFMRLPGSCDD